MNRNQNVKSREMENRFLQWFDVNKRLAFIAALIAGLATHFLQLTFGFMSPDGLTGSVLYSAGAVEASVGRWGLDFVDSLRMNQAVAAVSGLWALFWVVLAAVLLVDLFEFQSRTSVVLCSIAVMVFPTVAETLLYQYASDAYMLSFFLSVLALWCYEKARRIWIGVLGFIICEILSLSLYQAYLGVMIGGEIILILLLLLDGIDIKDAFRKGITFIVSAIVGLAGYLVLTKIILRVKHIEANSYNGFGSVSIGGFIKNLGGSIKSCYTQFAKFFLRDSAINNTIWNRHVFWMIFFIILVIIAILLVVEKKLWEDKIRFLLALALAMIIPLGSNFIFFLMPNSDMYAMNAMPMVLMLFLLAVLSEQVQIRGGFIARCSAVIASIAILFTYYAQDVYSYAYLKTSYDQTYSVTARILDRMENTEGYYRGMPVAFTDIITEDNYPNAVSYRAYVIDNIVAGTLFHPLFSGGQESYRKFILTNHGEILNFCDVETYKNVVETEEFEDMPVFPEAGSVKEIQGVMVVKMSESPAMP